ncbi:hypothetical protein H5410_056114 [Solanum commersonii]|uniref:Uncharacterized protein n=1 Tax=Solanum commersonii TaxID=4109 RepID=A0A9J5WLC0_SOLCO|nr:hypothetical protein H5410_056114 [Solanum commersonii]
MYIIVVVVVVNNDMRFLVVMQLLLSDIGTSIYGEDYCSTYYSNKNYQDTYAIPIEPLPCESTWDIPSHVLEEVMLPSIARKQPGRPPNNNRKKGNEGKYKRSKVTCSKCGTPRHNKNTCPKFTDQA